MAKILVANPGSASRKYAVFDGERLRLRLHFEYEGAQIVCWVDNGAEEKDKRAVILDDLTQAASQLPALLIEHGIDTLDAVALRVVAPSSYFLQHRRLDGEALEHLRAQQSRAPLHIGASLQELERLQREWPSVPVYGISDSAFHASKPDYAWNYGIRLEDADQFEIKRFGYHGLSTQSVVRQLGSRLPERLVICHLGSGASVIAVRGGVSVDATMGFSPLEGLIMSTRSGSIDTVAAHALQEALHKTDADMQTYLNEQSGLLGLSGNSNDIRTLLLKEHEGDYRAGLALKTYVHRVHLAVGGMIAALGGADALVFTGAVGERAPAIRSRIVANLHFLDFELDNEASRAVTERLDAPQAIHTLRHRPIYIVPAKEEYEMAKAAEMLLG